MSQNQWSAKRERQYQHIKDSLLAQHRDLQTAQEIAARTVNKERAQHGEAKTAATVSVESTPAPRRGSQHSHQGARGRTYTQLYADAKRAGLAGRSHMSKLQLEQALKQ